MSIREAEFPAGQWDYQLFYQENFDRARTLFEANVRNTVKALFRKGNPAGKGKPARTAIVRQAGGWFGSASAAAQGRIRVGVYCDIRRGASRVPALTCA